MHDPERQAERARPPDHPFIEGDGTGPDIWRASVRVFDAAVREGLRRQAQDRVDGGLRRREGVQASSTTGCPTRRVEAFRELPRRHQGPADDAGRRRHPLAQRRAAADARPVRLPAAGALVHGRALAGEAPREGRHGDLPREHRGHLRRHRVRRPAAPEAEEDPRLSSQKRVPEGIQEDPLRHGARSRASASSRSSQRGHRAARSAPRHRVRRSTQQAQERDARPQGQHHEVHRRRLPRLGLRAGASDEISWRRGNRRRAVVQDPRAAEARRGQSSSRTPSPTSRSSRC